MYAVSEIFQPCNGGIHVQGEVTSLGIEYLYLFIKLYNKISLYY